jgi:transposase InsO family protein
MGMPGTTGSVATTPITRIGCWDHARRKFVEASKAAPARNKGSKVSKADVAIGKIRINRDRPRFTSQPASHENMKTVVCPRLQSPISTVRNKVLFVLVVLAHHRRKVVHFNVTEHPTAQWTGQQVIESFPWDTAPKYLLRDRDAIYGSRFQSRVQSMGIEEVLSAPRSPWQNAFVERVIGSIRRHCLDHVVVLNDRHLKRILARYFNYYHRWRTHLSLGMDSPESRSVQLPAIGKVVQLPGVGGLHHHYERVAA